MSPIAIRQIPRSDRRRANGARAKEHCRGSTQAARPGNSLSHGHPIVVFVIITKASNRRATISDQEQRMLDNPFRPGFGSWPPAFVGRERDELLFREGLANGPGGRYHRSLVTGPRGVGKTVLLAAFRDIAEPEGYVTVAVDANDGMVRRICRDLRIIEAAFNDDPKWRVSKVRAGPGFGHIDFSRHADTAVIDEDPMVALKPLLERVAQTIVERGGAGLLLTVDELHAANTNELERLGNDLQHIQEIVFAAAALPTIDDQIFKSAGATFFSRLARFALEPLSIAESLAAIRPPFDDAGITYDQVELTKTVERTKGYPYLVQLLGYEIWHRLQPKANIDSDVLHAAYEAAHAQSIFDVLAPSWRQLSPSSKRVLGVIAANGSGPMRVADARERLGKTSSWFSVYRSRLIKAGVLEAPARGEVELAGGERAAEWILEQIEGDESTN